MHCVWPDIKCAFLWISYNQVFAEHTEAGDKDRQGGLIGPIFSKTVEVATDPTRYLGHPGNIAIFLTILMMHSLKGRRQKKCEKAVRLTAWVDPPSFFLPSFINALKNLNIMQTMHICDVFVRQMKSKTWNTIQTRPSALDMSDPIMYLEYIADLCDPVPGKVIISRKKCCTDAKTNRDP